MNFDFSDHIVLFIVQYIYPSFAEIIHLIWQKRLFDNNNNSGTIIRYLYWIPFLIALILILLSLRSLMFTMLFFHSPAENLVALLVCLIGLYFPLILNTPLRYYIEKSILM
jgi:hypothetical protein